MLSGSGVQAHESFTATSLAAMESAPQACCRDLSARHAVEALGQDVKMICQTCLSWSTANRFAQVAVIHIIQHDFTVHLDKT